MNSITYYIKDIKGVLDNNLYFSALALALTLPDICGLIMYPNLNSKARYKNGMMNILASMNKVL